MKTKKPKMEIAPSLATRIVGFEWYRWERPFGSGVAKVVRKGAPERVKAPSIGHSREAWNTVLL